VIRSLDDKTPRIHPSAFISETAYIVGDVSIGENTNIWPGAVIRGDYGRIVIGRNCSIQDNCVLHTDDYLELGDNVLMTHGAVIHGGRVGSNVMIGMNAALLEDSRVGSHCVIGAGAIVLGGAEIPDHSLVVGVPGRVRDLTPELERRIQEGIEMYLGNARRFKAAGLGQPIPEEFQG
jgi:carbonic anhydrase/acetyltransferase-like protein (isoleucine patch superfamily)